MKVHFIGIGGIGVSALARYYLAKGHKISGSDLNSSEITEALKKMGVKIFIGPHKCLRFHLKQTDLVIYSPAISPNNPEIVTAKKGVIKCQSYPEALGELTKEYFTIAVCGTHGKSTITAMISLILIKAGLNPTVIVGTKLREFDDSNFRMGGYPKKNLKFKIKNLKSLIIEADEHFASFLNYWPKIIVLTSLEPDHLDFYKNFKNYVSAFKKFISHLPKDGILIANKDDGNISKFLNSSHNNFSTAVKKLLYYSLRQKKAEKLKKILKVPGEYNVQNALAALTVARVLKIPDKISFKALSEYKGTWRRFEVVEADKRGYLRGFTPKITLISDYAHHPTKVRVTLKAAREKFPRRKIWLVYQPHQYQRTYYLFDDFVKIFQQALNKSWINKLIITDIFDVAGREEKEIKKKVNSEKLVASIKYKVSSKKKEEILYIPTIKETADYLKKNLRGGPPARTSSRRSRAGEVVIVMGAGDVYKLADLLIDPVRSSQETRFNLDSFGRIRKYGTSNGVDKKQK